ncbi:hypothetical protein [uncultured Clostridium sp.]|uniref:hypothetical protein n=1 Tax=uncultured Clostridium sp. TaxID=59620 RepID=UPI00260602B0|nr:hypothetical protein [uncultured Clostridium sp.]
MLDRLFKKTKRFKNEYEKTRNFLEEFRKENEAKWLELEELHRQNEIKNAENEIKANKQLEENKRVVEEIKANTDRLIERSNKLIEESRIKLEEMAKTPVIDLTKDYIKSNRIFNCSDRECYKCTGCKENEKIKVGDYINYKNERWKVSGIDEENQTVWIKDGVRFIVVNKEDLYREVETFSYKPDKNTFLQASDEIPVEDLVIHTRSLKYTDKDGNVMLEMK